MKTLYSTAKFVLICVSSLSIVALAGCGVRPIGGSAASNSLSQEPSSSGASSGSGGGSNNAPTLSSVSALSGASEDSAFTISYATLLAASNAADADGDAISFRVESVSTGTLTKGGSAVTTGTTLLSSGESLVWTPASEASGSLNAFMVKAYDGALASASDIQVVVSVSAVNDAPTLSSISTLSGATEDAAFTITYAALAAAANEADVEGSAISFRIEAVSTGTLTKGGSAVTAGSTLLSSGEDLVWTPAAHANGNLNAFTVKAHDGTSASSSAIQVVVNAAAVADAPTLSSVSTLSGGAEDVAVTITYATLLAASNAADVDGDTISFRVEAVSTGTLTKGGSAVTAGTTLLSSGEQLVWTPASSANGNLNAFTVKAYDGALASSSAIQVVVNVGSTNNAPTLTTISTLTAATEDTAFTITYAALASAANEADVDGDAIAFRVEAVSTGTLTKGGSAVTAGTTLLASGEELVWTPAPNVNGSGLNAFTVRAHDGTIASASAIQVRVDVSAVNDIPTLSSISTLSTATEDTAFTITYAALLAASNASDTEGSAISFRVEAVSTGTLTKGGSAVTAGSTLLSTGEELVWTPDANANGSLNAFTVKAYDGAAASTSAVQVVVSTNAANDAPTLTSISTLATATEDTAFTITYATLAGAADEADLEGSAISFRVEAVSTGTLTKSGSAVTAGTTLLSSGEELVWTPAANANGTLNAFTVKAYDGALASSSPIQVQVTTSAVNDSPTIDAIADQATNFNTATGAISVTIGDVETAAASLTLTKASSNTTLVPTANIVLGGSGTSRTVTITPASGQSGTADITLTVDDGTTTTSDTFQLTVYPRIDLEVPIEMLGVGVGSATVARQFSRSKTFLDTGDFDGTTSVTYYFEINAHNSHASNTYAVELVGSSGTAVATINVPPVATAGYNRFRSAAFTPTAGLSHYFVKTAATAANNNVTVGSARILVQQVGATKTRLYFPLLSYRSYSNVDISLAASSDYGMLTSYGQTYGESYALFQKDEAAYSQIASGTPWRFEVNMATASAAATMNVALFNHTAGAMVTGSELSGSSTNNTTYVDLSNSAANFTNGQEFEARYKSSDGAVNAQVFTARLSVKLTTLSKGRVYHRIRNSTLVTADSVQGAEGRTLYDSANYRNPTAYFEVTGSNSVASGGTLELQTMGVDDSGSSGTYITSSRLTPATTRGRLRSSALSLTSGDRFTTFWDWSSGTIRVGGAFLVIDFGI